MDQVIIGVDPHKLSVTIEARDNREILRATELVAGWLLWQHRRVGAVLALALLPLEFAFWIGFALPLGPVVGPG